MNAEEREKIVTLIKNHCFPAKREYAWSSYALKWVFEKLSGLYIHNEDFKSLMIEAGFQPTKRSRNDLNHRYKLMILPDEKINVYYWGKGSEPWRWIR